MRFIPERTQVGQGGREQHRVQRRRLEPTRHKSRPGADRFNLMFQVSVALPPVAFYGHDIVIAGWSDRADHWAWAAPGSLGSCARSILHRQPLRNALGYPFIAQPWEDTP